MSDGTNIRMNNNIVIGRKNHKKREIWQKKQSFGVVERERALVGLRSRTEWRERERCGGWDKTEICVLFQYSLWSGDILGGSQRDGRAFLFFLFFSWILFFLRFFQTNCFIFPSLCFSPLPSSRLFPLWVGNLKLSSVALLPCWRWNN